MRLRQATAQEIWRLLGASKPEKLPNHPLSQGPCNDAYTAESVMTKVKASRGHKITAMSEPLDPMEPGGSPSQSAGTAVLEREELRSTDDGDADRFAHYVRKDKIAAAAASGRPVVALCGKVWRPQRDPSAYPVCPTCKSIYEQMSQSPKGNGPRRPRFPFGGRG